MTSAPSRFAMEFEVRADAIDELGHVSNVVYLEWALEIAKAHSIASGYDHRAYIAMGTAFVVRRHEIDYHRPVFENQRAMLATWVESWTSASCIRRTEVRIAGADSDAAPPLAASLSTQWVYAALPSGRPRRIPAELRAAFE